MAMTVWEDCAVLIDLRTCAHIVDVRLFVTCGFNILFSLVHIDLHFPAKGPRHFIRVWLSSMTDNCNKLIVADASVPTPDTEVQQLITPSVTATAGSSSEKHAQEDADVVDGQCSKKQKTENNIRGPKRRKAAMLLSYSGNGYYGMQRNRDVDTIEESLLSAMLKAGIINQENFDVPQSMGFQRAARTDKGVSAARQVVSLRIVLSNDLVERINSNLPPQIRVIDIKRGTKGFNSKYWCDARTYSYTMPTFAFAPSTELTTYEYRTNEEVINRVNGILNEFKGTHNFHNFTSGRKPTDPSASRFIMNFECGKPFVEGDLELVVITVKGQSFMLHQIRKMIGVVIAMMRDLTSRDVIQKAWSSAKVDIPIAPGVGLVLEELHYDKYNSRYGSDGMHDILDWSEHAKVIEQFKKDLIYPTIVKAEMEEKSMFQWLSTLPLHVYDVREAQPELPVQRSQTRSPFGKALVTIELETATISSNSAEDVNGTVAVEEK